MLITQENASAIVQEIQDNPDPEIEYHISVFSAERFEGRYVVKPSTIEIEHDGQWVEPLEELTRYLHQNCKVIVSRGKRGIRTKSYAKPETFSQIAFQAAV